MALTLPWEELFEAAKTARERAHAPYSRFLVGAAVFYGDGAVIVGCNVENSSYGLTVCAERNALARGVVEGRGKPLAIAVVTDSKVPCPPCGSCRQVMAELAGPDLPVRSRNLQGQEDMRQLGELLPHAFDGSFL